MIKNDGYGCSPNPYEEGTESGGMRTYEKFKGVELQPKSL